MVASQGQQAFTLHSPSFLLFITLLFSALMGLSGCGQQYSASGSSSGSSSPGYPLPGGGGGGNPGGNSTATLEWETPTTNDDQTCLTNLAGYIISYGTTPGAATYQQSVPASALSCVNTSTVTACGTVQTCTYTVSGLSAGQWYFSSAAYNSELVTGLSSNDAAVTVN